MQTAIIFDCNLYLARLADHGVDTTDAMLYYTVDRSWESAKQALAIGKALGEKVIIMSTSTGGTLALALAAEFPDDVYALINMSPNVKINDPLAWIGNNHWGAQIGKMVKGESIYAAGEDSLYNQYWSNPFRIEAAAELEEMVEDKMTAETFKKVKCPSLSLYYYNNEKQQDQTVAVKAIIEMNKQLGTPDSLKEAIAIPNAGDHVMGSYIKSKDLEGVQREIRKFAIEKLKLKPVSE
ncbi:MAG TPA: hypothetical protein PLR06_02740 [Cyclobacteriaceae bacterium]|nr:hypothetical protein [Cyclobacteriaceae bacterium]